MSVENIPVVVTLTRAEAQALVQAHHSLLHEDGSHPDWPAFDRAVDKLQHQLAAVQAEESES